MAFDFTLCADDYGMTGGVSRGILELAAMGRLSAASAMTNLPDWPRAAAAWRDARPPAGLGLHLNLTLGRPLGAMPQFAPSGVFAPVDRLVRRGDVPRDELAAEIAHQIDAFTTGMGRPPTHLDGHQHVHMLRPVRATLFAVLREKGLAGLPLRDAADRPARIVQRRQSALKAATVALLGRGFGREARAAGFSCNDGFAGFSRFDPAADLATQFDLYLRASGPDHLVMCHPGFVDADLEALDPVTQTRQLEWDFLASPAFPAVLARHDARLVSNLSRP